MNLDNCPRCGKIYTQTIRNLCPSCIKLYEHECALCSKYLKEHRVATIDDVSRETGVETIQIIRFIRDGRISIAKNPNINYKCESCNAPIREGNLCIPCRNRLINSFEEVRSMPESNQPSSQNRSTYNVHRDRKDK